METVAVLGASPKEDRYSNKAMKLLDEYGHTPIPVAPKYETIEGKKVFHDLDDVEEQIDTITLYLGPKRQTDEVVDKLIKAAPKRIIFNPDTENKAASEKIKAAGINVVEACTLVLLRTNQY